MRLLKLRDVEQKTARKKSKIYHDINAGTFPRPVPQGPKSVAWLEHEIDEWIAKRVAERDSRKVAA
jgi:prophage regulatory protein